MDLSLLQPTSRPTTTVRARVVDSLWLSFWVAPQFALTLAPFVFALWQVLAWRGVAWPDRAQQATAAWIRRNKHWLALLGLPFFLVCFGFFVWGHLGLYYYLMHGVFR